MPDEPDGGLLRRFVQGDTEAFESLFRQFEVEVYRWILSIVRDSGAAEDAVVETFWRAYRGRARFDTSRSFGAWIRRIATNAARDQLRAARSRGWNQSDIELAAPVARREDGSDESRASVARAFAGLPPRLQVAATLALIEERPYAEIADTLGVPMGTVKSRVFRAIRTLRKEL